MVIERKKEILEEQSLSILIDTKDYNNTQLISELITQYKMINIVTSNRNQFAGLEEEAEQNFEPISVLNNKRKSLRNAKYILNVDFSGEKIKEYSIDRTAIIFNVADTKIDKLMYFDGNIINPNKPICIGNSVWIASHVDILKGSSIPDGCVLGFKSLLTSKFKDENCIIAGIPAKILKKDIHWEV